MAVTSFRKNPRPEQCSFNHARVKAADFLAPHHHRRRRSLPWSCSPPPSGESFAPPIPSLRIRCVLWDVQPSSAQRPRLPFGPATSDGCHPQRPRYRLTAPTPMDQALHNRPQRTLAKRQQKRSPRGQIASGHRQSRAPQCRRTFPGYPLPITSRSRVREDLLVIGLSMLTLPLDVKVSSFFSLHRPISLERAIPPVASNTSIKTLFTPRSPYSKRMTAENIQTLSNGIESLEAALRAHEKQAPEDLLQPEVQHLDSHPQVSLEELMARFVPFRPPPPPAVFGEGAEPHATKAIEDEVVTLPVTHRTWSTKVLVTESTDSAGNLTYSATTAPMVEVFGPGAENGQETEQFAVRQPFLARMSQRVYANSRDVQRPDMQAISVKRQRKLKMKKHKYKKLMKRTRLLRRKLDRN